MMSFQFRRIPCKSLATGLAIYCMVLAGFNDNGILMAQQPNEGQDPRYVDAVDELLPVAPEDIDSFQEDLEDVRSAVHDRKPLKVETTADIVALDPGSEPPAIAVSPGIATVIVFTDATGQPWPLAGFTVGDGAGFDVSQLSAEGKAASSITVAPKRVAGWTNLVIHLKEEARPVILTLTISLERVHYRYDIQVLGEGPLARPTLGHQLIEPPRAGDRSMLAFISAVDIPENAQRLDVSGVPNIQAWSDGQTMWVRTPWVLLSPQFEEVMVLGDIRVYRLPVIATLLFFVKERTMAAQVDLS